MVLVTKDTRIMPTQKAMEMRIPNAVSWFPRTALKNKSIALHVSLVNDIIACQNLVVVIVVVAVVVVVCFFSFYRVTTTPADIT